MTIVFDMIALSYTRVYTAAQLTAENFDAVAKWCGGRCVIADHLEVPTETGSLVASLGNYVVKNPEGCFRVWERIPEPRKIKRYLLFEGGARGGWGDFVDSFDSRASAHAARDQRYDWFQIVDIETGEVHDHSTC